jgi:hypothetical protein
MALGGGVEAALGGGVEAALGGGVEAATRALAFHALRGGGVGLQPPPAAGDVAEVVARTEFAVGHVQEVLSTFQ